MYPHSLSQAGLLPLLCIGFSVSFLVVGFVCAFGRFATRLQSFWPWQNTTEPSDKAQNKTKIETQTNRSTLEIETEYEVITENDVNVYRAQKHVYDGLNSEQKQKGTQPVAKTKDVNNTSVPKTNDALTTNSFPRTKVVIPEVFREKKPDSMYHLYFEPLADTYDYAES